MAERLNPERLNVRVTERPLFPGMFNPRRVLLQTLAANPREAANYLTRKGYKGVVIDGRVYAARPGEDTLLALDPKGADRGDVADLADEILGGIFTGIGVAGGALAGAPGGPPGVAAGGVVGGVGASGAFESARQLAGGLAGVNVRPDVGAVTEAAIGGGLAVPGAAMTRNLLGYGVGAARFTGRKAAAIIRSVIGKAVGGLSEADVERATRSPEVVRQVVSETARTSMDVLDRLRSFMGRMREAKLPEYKRAMRMLEKPGVRKVPIRKVIHALTRDRQPVGSVERAAVEEARKIALDIAGSFGGLDPQTGAPSLIAARGIKVKAAVNEAIKRKLQGLVDWREGRPQHQDLLNAILKEAQLMARRETPKAIPDIARRGEFRNLMVETGRRLRPLEKLERKFGEEREGAENLLRNIFRPGKTQVRRLLETAEERHPGRLGGVMEDLKTASVAEPFSREAPRMLTTGGILGTGTGASVGGGLGYMFGGVPGAAVGAPVGMIAGTLAASPKGMLRAGRVVTRGLQALEGGTRAVERFTGRVPEVPPRALERVGAAAVPGGVSLATRELELPGGVVEQRRTQRLPEPRFEVRIEGDDEDAERVRAIAEEVGSREDLTPEEKLDEILRRANEGRRPVEVAGP